MFSQMDQRLWAVDLSLYYSDSLAMFQLMSYVTGGQLNTRSHVFEVEPPKERSKTRKRRLAGTEEVSNWLQCLKVNNCPQWWGG